MASALLPALLEAAQLDGGADLVRYVHHDADKAAIAALAPAVTAAARGGDPLALDILRTGAGELALLVRSVIERSCTHSIPNCLQASILESMFFTPKAI
jgi:N-acetylglucosamine kinase-like BadF-type ATPase